MMISVAMTTYNGSRYLAAQLDSILQQTTKIDEIIIIDDCSVDTTLALLGDYQAQYSHIKVYSNLENLGVVKSFERAISLCNGDFVALADQDDVWFPDKIEKLVANIGENWLIHSDDILVDEQLNILADSHFAAGKSLTKINFFDYLINVNVTGCTVLLARELIDLALPFKTYLLPHEWYLTYFAAYRHKIRLLKEPLVYYRQHAVNVCGAKKKSYLEYLDSCNKVGRGLAELALTPFFNQSQELKFMSDYKLSLYNRSWKSTYNIFYLLGKGLLGIKLIIFYYLITLPPPKLSRKIYSLIRKRI